MNGNEVVVPGEFRVCGIVQPVEWDDLAVCTAFIQPSHHYVHNVLLCVINILFGFRTPSCVLSNFPICMLTILREICCETTAPTSPSSIWNVDRRDLICLIQLVLCSLTQVEDIQTNLTMADRRAELERKRKMLADLKAKKEMTREQRDPSRDRSIPGIPDMRTETEDLLKSLGLGKGSKYLAINFTRFLRRS